MKIILNGKIYLPQSLFIKLATSGRFPEVLYFSNITLLGLRMIDSKVRLLGSCFTRNVRYP